MALWSFYFLAKLLLYYRGAMDFHPLPNAFLLAAAVALPRLKMQRGASRTATGLLAAAGALQLWNDSFLPPLSMAVGFLTDSATRPSGSYIAAFLFEAWSPVATAFLAALLGACLFATRRGLRLEYLAAALMLVPAVRWGQRLAPARDASSIEARFFNEQMGKRVPFAPPKAASRPFDILLIHVCSLSWDDLQATEIDTSDFFSRFDLLMTSFNSVTTYSNPAAIRLLRSACGQSSHGDLYNEAPRECYLTEALKSSGYKNYTVLNHPGKYSDMAKSIAELGRAAPMSDLGPMPVEEVNFDGDPIYSNYATLEAWWKSRQASGEPRAALYYNSLSLHDGARRVGDEGWWKRPRPEKYREFAKSLFEDLGRFFDLVASSGRDALVVFIPEHGSAINGSRIQAKGLRDIPLPSITNVPVAVRFISSRPRPATQQKLDKPFSYLAVSQLISDALRHPPDPEAPFPALSLATLPTTPFFAENQHAAVMRAGEGYLVKDKEGKWSALDTDLATLPASEETGR